MANDTIYQLEISLPGTGKTQTYHLEPGTPVKFDFDLANAVFTGTHGDLEITVEGGGTVILENYQALADTHSLPLFEMINGEQVAGDVYLFAFDGVNQNGDVETAAGNANGSSGAGQYNDDPGTLLGGVDALDGQGDAYGTHTFATLGSPTLDNQSPRAVDDFNSTTEEGDGDLIPGKTIAFVEGEDYDGNPAHYLTGWGEGEIDPDHVTYLPLNTGGGLLIYNPNPDQVDTTITGNVIANDSDDGPNEALRIASIDYIGTPHGGTVDVPAETAVTDGTQIYGQYGILTINADGSYTYTLNQEWADSLNEGDVATETFHYTITDDEGAASNTATLTINVVGTNDMPVALPDTNIQAVEQGDSAGYDLARPGEDVVTGHDYTASVNAFGNVLLGTVTNGEGETISQGDADFDPDSGDSVTDGSVFVIGAYSNETHAYDYDHELIDSATPEGFANAASHDANGFTVTGEFGTLHVNADGSYSYILNNESEALEALNYDHPGTETFTYAIMDDSGAVSYATITFTVNGANDAPVAEVDSANIMEQGLTFLDGNSVTVAAAVTGNVLLNDTDVDNVDFGNAADGHPETGTTAEVFVSTASTAGYTDVHGDYHETDSTPATVYNNDGDVTDSIQITGHYGTLTIYENGEYSYQLDNTNPEVQSLNAGDSVVESFDYTATNSYGDGAESNTSHLNITIHGSNDAPTLAISQPTNVVTFIEDGIDGSGNPIGSGAVHILTADQTVDIFDVDTPASELSVTLSAGDSWVQGDVLGVDTSGPSVSMGDYDSNSATTIYSYQNAAGDVIDIIVNNHTGTVTLAGHEGSTDSLTYDDFANALKTITFGVDPNDDTPEGADRTFSVVVSDNEGSHTVYDPSDTATGDEYSSTTGTASTEITVHVQPSNDAPLAVDDGVEHLDDMTVTLNVGNQFNADGITIVNAGTTDTPTINAEHGLGIKTGPGDNPAVDTTQGGKGSEKITFKFDDPQHSASITLGDFNHANDHYNDDNAIITLLDADGNVVRTYEVGGETDPTIPLGTEDGSTFTYVVVEPAGGTEDGFYVASISGTVGNENTDGAIVTPEDTDIIISVLGNDSDPDGDTLTISGTTDPEHGSVSVNADGTITYKPEANYNGDDHFTYTVSDGHGGTDTATVYVNVTPVNDAPLAVNDDVTIDEDHNATGNVIQGQEVVNGDGTISYVGQDTDPDHDWLTVTKFTVDGHDYAAGKTATIDGVGTLTMDKLGNYTFTPEADYNGDVPKVTYTVADDDGATSQADLNIHITPVNDAPVAYSNSASITEASGSHEFNVTLSADDHLENGQWSGDDFTVTAGTASLDGATHALAFEQGGDLSAGYGGDHLTIKSGSGDHSEIDTNNGNNSGSEAVSIDFDNPMDTVTIHLSSLYNAASHKDGSNGTYYTEKAMLAVYDANGNLIGMVEAHGSKSGDVSVTLDADKLGSTIGSVVLMPMDDGAGNSANNSDFQIDSVSGTTAHQVGGSVDGNVIIDSGEHGAHDPSDGTPIDHDPDTGDTLHVTHIVHGSETADGAPAGGTALADGDDSTSATIKGDYGTLTIHEDGSYTYSEDTSLTDKLADKETGHDVFTYTVSDGHGGTDTAELTIDITGTNDAPTIDLDAGTGTVTFVTEEAAFNNIVGLYTVDGNGNPVIQEFLIDNVNGGHHPGEVLTTYEDGAAPHYFLIPVTGAAITDTSNYTITGDSTHGYKISFEGDDATYPIRFDNEAMNGGAFENTFRISQDADGSWQIAMDDQANRVDDDDFDDPILQQDDNGTGYLNTFVEDGGPVHIAGEVNISDVDSDTLNQVVIKMDKIDGSDSLSLDGHANGTFTFTVGDETISATITDNGSAITVTLSGSASPEAYEDAIGHILYNNDSDTPDTSDRTITVQVWDDHNAASNVAETTLHVVAANDAPTAADNVEAMAENGGTHFDTSVEHVSSQGSSWSGEEFSIHAGKAHGSGEDLTFSESGNLAAKNISFNHGGEHYDYSGVGISGEIGPGSANSSQEAVNIDFKDPMDSVTIKLAALFDGTVYDHGNQEMAVVNIYDSQGNYLGTETVYGSIDGRQSITLNASDYNSADIGSVVVLPGDNGASGGDNSDFLIQNVSGTTLADATPLTGNVITDNDAAHGKDSDPEGDALHIASFTHDGADGTAGDYHVGDADYDHMLGGDHGTLYYNAQTGDYVYVEDGSLADGATGTETFNYSVEDTSGAESNTATLTINITGANAPAQFSGEDAGSVTEDTNVTTDDGVHVLTATGQLAVTDVDSDTALTVVDNDNHHGNLTIDGSGKWTYTIDNDSDTVQHLDDGQSLTETFTVRSADGTEHQIEVTINGVDDNSAPMANPDTAYGSAELTQGSSDYALVAQYHPGYGDWQAGDITTHPYGGHGEQNGPRDDSGYLESNGYAERMLINFTEGQSEVVLTVDADEWYGDDAFTADVQVMSASDPDVALTLGTDYAISRDHDGHITITALTDTVSIGQVILTPADDNIGGGTYKILLDDVSSTPTSSLNLTLTGDVTRNDTDADGDTLHVDNFANGHDMATQTIDGVEYTHYVDGEHGVLYYNESGQYLYKADSGLDAGTYHDTFTYTATDGTTPSGATTLIVNLDITAPNPVSAADDISDVVNNSRGNYSAEGNVITDDASHDYEGADSHAQGNALQVTGVSHDGDAASSGGWVGGAHYDYAIRGEYGTLYLDDGGAYHYSVDSSQFKHDDWGVDYDATVADHGAPLVDQFTYTVSDGHGGEDTATLYVPIADVIDWPMGGSESGDAMYGSHDNDYIDGRGGNDDIYGRAGNDVLHGGAGDDHLNGNSGHDLLFGDSGNDVLNGGAGHDFLSGGSGDDTLHGGSGNDLLVGGSGNDTLDGGAGDDVINAGSGNDHILVSAGHDTVTLGEGADTIHIDPTYLAGDNDSASMTVTDFNASEGDKLILSFNDNQTNLGDLVGKTVDISSSAGSNDLSVHIADVHGNQDLTITLQNVLGDTHAAGTEHMVITPDSAPNDDLNQMIQHIINSGMHTS
ncbi:VCBS domain-containing protein [Desulfovibrio sp. Huiquan2017]|uniref:VCBS domain-containing protein n=1 Tax=Desulfovibrio sp. Huiquan2017 TaxID=2816861 RepID=UPI001A911508|nr:VCBS domain-containing protein [Desulfovibrio sp. Huiquan2017]